ncbi:hypothetical protein [Paracoccus sp. PAR01]|uniref:hypothetical protein n=1 Tax=Paracoccus sp. PAR01 TaxID=2769282 RepID=UPI001783290B|nr:hypothetical protein [Paracoccus sp. PAR01]MBD9529872.1 hypothetical protein [Paracoccus sp. PAR01]
MAQGKGNDPQDPELDRALADLLAQTRNEPIPPRLRELADRLAQALEASQMRQKGEPPRGGQD